MARIFFFEKRLGCHDKSNCFSDIIVNFSFEAFYNALLMLFCCKLSDKEAGGGCKCRRDVLNEITDKFNLCKQEQSKK